MTLKKFTKESMKKAIEKAIAEMSEEDAYETCAGVYNLYMIMGNYYMGRYGNNKRIHDMFEYVTILQNSYLKKGSQ